MFKIYFIFLLLIYTSYQANNYSVYPIDVYNLSPLQFTYQGYITNSCPIDYPEDMGIICRQFGYQITNFYREHTINLIDCGDQIDNDFFYFDCYGASYSGLHFSECPFVEYQYCDNCVELICHNYRCSDQESDSHDCITCIGNAATNERTAPSCECNNGFVDLYPEYEDCQPDVNIPEEGSLATVDYNGNKILKIYHNNSYMTICGGNTFNEISAIIACNQMGFNAYKKYYPIECPYKEYDENEYESFEDYALEVSSWTYLYGCDGTEQRIQDCDRLQFSYYACTGDFKCIHLECQNLLPGDGQLRMDGGVPDSQNIVEIQHINTDTNILEWRPICDYSIDDNLAHVMCLQSGFKTFKTYFKGQECPLNNETNDGTNFWFGRLICEGDENSITRCRQPDGWVQDKYPCKCILLQCTNEWDLPIEGDVRIHNNAIQIYHDSQWGQICTEKPLQKIGQVVCKQLRKQYQNLKIDKISNLSDHTTEKQQYICPDYTNFWISDINCPSGIENTLLDCNIDSKWGKHTCQNTDCIFLACDGDVDIANLTHFQNGDLTLTPEKQVMIYFEGEWKPLRDNGNEYNPSQGQYGHVINKTSAHVICKQMGFATYKSFQSSQKCESGFNGYGIGNIMCKGNEGKLTECFHQNLQDSTSAATDDTFCVKMECSQYETCVGEHKVSLSKYPFCTCKDGYYDDGFQADCLPCSKFCKTCIFSATNCLVCSQQQANYEILNYKEWYHEQGLFLDLSENFFSRRILQENEPQDCETNQCCHYNQFCNYCSHIQCIKCFNDGYPDHECKTTLDESELEEENECYHINSNCEECNLEQKICTKCKPNYDGETNCLYLYPNHHKNAPCVHISEFCIDCKGDICYECTDNYLSDYNCQYQQNQDCTSINENCLECETELDQCTSCIPNYDSQTNCQSLLSEGHSEAPCVQFNKNCLECNATKCEKCAGYWDPKYNCQILIPIEEQCIESNCNNCIGYSCLNETFDYSTLKVPIVEYEQQTTISLKSLTYQQYLMTLVVNTDGKIESPNEEYIDIWGVYTCSLYCAEGYFKDANGNCQKCSDKCQVCAVNKNNCIICKYQNNKYVGEPPNCNCLPGSRIVGANCQECEQGFYNFQPQQLQCRRCPDNADCFGGEQIKVKQGYWRESQTSSIVVHCQNNEGACKGGDHTNTNKQCIEGHIGALCETCDINGEIWGEKYANSGDFSCSKCSKVENNAIKLIGMNLIQFVSMFLSVNGTIGAIQDKVKFNSLKNMFNTHEPTPDESGVLMKILNNYLFVIGVITTFQLEIPSGFQSANSTVSNSSKQMSYSFDCFLNSLDLDINLIYLKVYWQIFIGIFQLLFVFIVIIIGKKINFIISPIKSAIFTTIIYQFVSMQPGLLTMIIESIACKEVADQKYVLSNTTIQCSGDDYFTYTFSIMLPLFLIFGLLIPYILYRMIKSCYQFDLEKARQKDFEKSHQQILQHEHDHNNHCIQDQNKQQQKSSYSCCSKSKNTKKEENSQQTDNKTQQQQKDSNQNNKNNKSGCFSCSKKQNKSEEKENQQETQDQEDKSKQNQILDREKELQSQIPREQYLECPQPLGKYGFLYLEYKNYAYWWEFVKIYQRLLIVMTLAFYYNDIKVKGILVFLIVFFYTVLSIRYQPYRLDSHNRIDVIANTVTGVSLILGIFIYSNIFPEWVIIAAIIMILLNAYFLILMILRIAYQYTKNFVTQSNTQIEQQEQIALFDEQMKERKEIINKLQELEDQKTELANQNDPKNDDKIAELENTISEYNQEIIRIEELLFNLEYLPKQKLDELQSEIEQLPSFILLNCYEQNIIKEKELKIRFSKKNFNSYKSQFSGFTPKQQQKSPYKDNQNFQDEINDKQVKQNPTEIELQIIEENENKNEQNKIYQNEKENKEQKEIKENKEDNQITQNQQEEDQKNETQKQDIGKQYSENNSKKTKIHQIKQKSIVKDDDINQSSFNSSFTNNKQSFANGENFPQLNQQDSKNENNQNGEENENKHNRLQIINKIDKKMDKRMSSIMNKKIENLNNQFQVSIQEETQKYASLSKKSKLKSRSSLQNHLKTKNDYIQFLKMREKQKETQKPNFIVNLVQKIGEIILSLFIGKTNAEDMRKAKFLRQLIQFYFQNLIVQGYKSGLVELSTTNEKVEKLENPNNADPKPIIPIYDLLNGIVDKETLQMLVLDIKDDQKFQQQINKEILQKVSLNYAKRLKHLKYNKIIWEEKLYHAHIKKVEDMDQCDQSHCSDLNQDIELTPEHKKYIQEKVKYFSTKLSDKDIKQQYTSFQLFDIKGRRVVTGEDINNIMIKLNQNISKQMLDKMINSVDNNENGEVDFCEFLALIACKHNLHQDDIVMREIFNFYCRQSNGLLDYLDIDTILRNIYDIKESKAVLKEIIRQIDSKLIGSLDIVSFQKLIY